MFRASDTNDFPNWTGIRGKIPLGEIGIQDKSGAWHYIREVKSPNTLYRYFEDSPGRIRQVASFSLMDDMPKDSIRYISDRKAVNDDLSRKHASSMALSRMRKASAALRKASADVNKASAASAEKKDSGSTIEKNMTGVLKASSSSPTKSSSPLKDVSNLPSAPAELTPFLLKKIDSSIAATKENDIREASMTSACGHFKNGFAKPDKKGK